MAKKKISKKKEDNRGIGYDQEKLDELLAQGVDMEDAMEQAKTVPEE